MGHYVMFPHPIKWTNQRIQSLIKTCLNLATISAGKCIPHLTFPGWCRLLIKCSMWIPKSQSFMGWRTDTGSIHVCILMYNPSCWDHKLCDSNKCGFHQVAFRPCAASVQCPHTQVRWYYIRSSVVGWVWHGSPLTHLLTEIQYCFLVW